MKKLISLLLSLTLLLSSAGKAFAALPEEDTIGLLQIATDPFSFVKSFFEKLPVENSSVIPSVARNPFP